MLKFTEARRQGEIITFKLPDNYTISRRVKKVRGNVIREGEKSGHQHKVEGDGQLVLFPGTDDMVVEVGKNGAKITHPEHKPVTLPPGKHVVKVQKEYDPGKDSKDVKD